LNPLEKTEKLRITIQDVLDAVKSQRERNKLGQFATPLPLALDILGFAKSLIPETKVRFLDPAFGTGSFYSALLQTFGQSEVEAVEGYEIDRRFGEQARTIWKETDLHLHIADFTKASPDDRLKANLLICNPPYVRHHHLSQRDKERLRAAAESATGVRLSGLAGLYCYYMLLAHQWMDQNAVAGWLVPTEFMDVNYGTELKNYLMKKVTLLRIHRFDPSEGQFADADVSSAIVWFRNASPTTDHSVTFSEGEGLSNPNTSRVVPLSRLKATDKWTPLVKHASWEIAEPTMRLSDLFVIKRGLATGANEFFILDEKTARGHDLPAKFLIPILPMPRMLDSDEVFAENSGEPKLKRKLYLLSCGLAENAVRQDYPALWKYLRSGIVQGIHGRYLCKHRTPWYSQERRPPAPFLCSYFGRTTESRETPFRFILNYSNATATNAYLMLYPRPTLQNALDLDLSLYRKVWTALKQITRDTLVVHGRVYGGGLHKLEPKELLKVPADGLLGILANYASGK